MMNISRSTALQRVYCVD